MRLNIGSVVLLSAVAAGVLAEDNLQQIVEKMPGCAVSCYADAASKSGCDPEDFKCVCNSLLRLPARMGTCLSRNDCTDYSKQPPGPASSLPTHAFQYIPPVFCRDESWADTCRRARRRHIDASDSLGDICKRMDEKPSSTEVSAASSAVAQAVATAKPTGTGESVAGANGIAWGGVLGAAVAVAAML